MLAKNTLALLLLVLCVAELSADPDVIYWKALKKTDPMTDAISCQVIPTGDTMPFPMFFYHSQHGVSAAVVGGDFPGEQISFRVDKNPVVSEAEILSGPQVQRVVSYIRAGGKTLLVKSYGWPNQVPVLREWPLDGITSKLDECKAAIKR